MAQTALQTLIQFIHDNPNCGEVEILFKAKKLLHKEREYIISAWDDGKVTGCVIGSNDYTNETENDNGSHYFDTTFKTN